MADNFREHAGDEEQYKFDSFSLTRLLMRCLLSTRSIG
jgi:hypothetical protein